MVIEFFAILYFSSCVNVFMGRAPQLPTYSSHCYLQCPWRQLHNQLLQDGSYRTNFASSISLD